MYIHETEQHYGQAVTAPDQAIVNDIHGICQAVDSVIDESAAKLLCRDPQVRPFCIDITCHDATFRFRRYRSDYTTWDGH